jgi:oligoribonuclease NrnB/cAMP/cGMP phosphodiesterase (DHH superfamily)
MGFKVAIINSNDLQSEIGAHLYEKYPVDFVIIYSLNGAGLVNIGLRSKNPTGTDVSNIAKMYGGGGHKHSAGCSAATEIIHQWYGSPFFSIPQS